MVDRNTVPVRAPKIVRYFKRTMTYTLRSTTITQSELLYFNLYFRNLDKLYMTISQRHTVLVKQIIRSAETLRPATCRLSTSTPSGMIERKPLADVFQGNCSTLITNLRWSCCKNSIIRVDLICKPVLNMQIPGASSWSKLSSEHGLRVRFLNIGTFTWLGKHGDDVAMNNAKDTK